MATSNTNEKGAVQTTGHAWDGDLQEFNNPLPTWWVWTFYATTLFALAYWAYYPTWPLGESFTKGVGQVTYQVGDQQVTSHWNTRAELAVDMVDSDEAVKQREYLQKVAASSYDEILNDAEMMSFVNSISKGLFGDNCAACHATGGAGIVGKYPTLADDDWLWGGKIADIEHTINAGRVGYMPDFKGAFTDEQLDDLSTYVLSMSGESVDQAAAQRGGDIFNGQAGGCYYCHTKEGTGMLSQGAANLTDSVWTLVDVQGAASVEDKKSLVKSVITNGVMREMPKWENRLKPEEIKLLTVYVHQLGGGQ